MAGNTGGPWGGGGNNGSGGDDDRGNGGRKPGNEGPNIPEIDDLVNKGREQLRVLMGAVGVVTTPAALAAVVDHN